MSDEQPTVRVTLGAIYETVLSIDKKVDPLPRQVADLETRLRVVEQQMWKWLGASASIALIISAVVAFVASLIQKG